MKYPVLIPYKQTSDNGLELRYTLRALKNIKQWNGEVILCGDKPGWVQNVTHVTARPSNNRYIDAELKIRAGLEVAPETFIFMNDDQYCLSPTEIKDWYAGELTQNGTGPHQANRLYTRNWLLDRGYEPLDYSLHTPMIMDRDKRKQVSDIVMQDHSREQFRTLLARTLYGSMFIKDPELRDDHKIRGKDFVSNDIVSTNGFMNELHDLFPEKSKFEADTAPGNYSVSVIMPVYNEEELLTKALDSIPKNVAEIIVVNDGSTDDTLKIAREWAKTDTRAKVYSNRANKGVGYTINRCYDLATSDYTVILSGDDYMHPEMQQVINRIDGSDFVFFNLSYNIKGKIRRPTPKNYKSWAGSCKLVRRAFMEGVRASNKLVNEDLELYQMLLAKPHTTQFTDIMGKHYNTPRLGSLTDRKQKGEFGQEFVTVGSERHWRRFNAERHP